MKVASEDEVAADFAEYVKASKKGPVVVTIKGKPVAVLLRTENEDDLERLLMGHSHELQAILEAARKRFRERRGIPHASFWKEIEAKPSIAPSKRNSAKKQTRSKARNGTKTE